ncbi:histidine phosphatase family protein [Gallaecimonas sp. GXIMD4217]|uniref:SixA phosphatase family protein n=1 Tax=Gallaecimonas sp. GXIMD4217 TaxID=3131927 RepID=UPI00311AF7E3
MPHRLTLIRHGKSSWRHEELGDRFRPLSGRGYRQVTLVASWLKTLPQPDHVLVSDAVRTYSTAQMLAHDGAFGESAILLLPELYGADADTILACCRKHPHKHLAVVAHNPGLEALLARLGHAKPMPSLAVAQLVWEGGWDNLSDVKLAHYATPDMLQL